MSVKGSSGRGAKKEKRRSYSNKAGLQFPVARIGRYLRKAKVANRVAKGDKWLVLIFLNIDYSFNDS